MKLEIAAIILLCAMLLLSIYNVKYIDDLAGELLALVDEAETLAVRGENELAAKNINQAAGVWAEKDFYTHITMRHSEIDMCTDMFHQLIGQLLEEGAGQCAGGFSQLRARLENIADIERVSLRSVL